MRATDVLSSVGVLVGLGILLGILGISLHSGQDIPAVAVAVVALMSCGMGATLEDLASRLEKEPKS